MDQINVIGSFVDSYDNPYQEFPNIIKNEYDNQENQFEYIESNKPDVLVLPDEVVEPSDFIDNVSQNEKKTSTRKVNHTQKYQEYLLEKNSPDDEQTIQSYRILGKRKYTKSKENNYNAEYKSRRERNRESAYNYRIIRQNEFDKLTLENESYKENYNDVIKNLIELKNNIETINFNKNMIIDQLNKLITNK